MEPFDQDELSDRELDTLLAEWNVPPAPARLRAALFPGASTSWWRRIWSSSIRIPAPAACCLAVLLVSGAWLAMSPRTAKVVIRTERIEVPVIKTEVVTRTVFRDRIVRVPSFARSRAFDELQPVAELRPRIMRSGDVQD